MKRAFASFSVVMVVVTVLAGAPAVSARSAFTYRGIITGATCASGEHIGTVSGVWVVNVTPSGGEISYTMFEDGKVHAVVTSAYPWERVSGEPPWVFTMSAIPGSSAVVTLTTTPTVQWRLDIDGAPRCADFTATGVGFGG
jgi:hypothetical protein